MDRSITGVVRKHHALIFCGYVVGGRVAGGLSHVAITFSTSSVPVRFKLEKRLTVESG